MMSLLTPSQRSRVQHIPCDFLSSPEEIANALTAAQVQATHVFFYSYMQPAPPKGQPLWSNADELVRVNTALLTNFLSALPLASIHPQRILLQTGAKNYGVHIGRTRQPAQEPDPQPSHLDPNFYYPQESALFAYCKDNPSVAWNIIMPAWIIGAVTNAAMNALHPFAVYAAVQAAQSKPLVFPSDWPAWQQICNHSTARLTGYLTEWAVLEPKCANQRFNSTDTSPFTFERFFGELARWFGVTGGVEAPSVDGNEYFVVKGRSGKETPMGVGPSVDFRVKFSLVAWAKEEGNREVWKGLMSDSQKKKKGDGGDGVVLSHDPFEDPEAHFSCGDAAWLPATLGMDKARKMGWSGYVDTVESVFEMYRDMVVLGMLPAMKVQEAREVKLG